MKKVLIITYYWPPSGGAGVQRWVKLTKYLSNYGIKSYVITVNEKNASYMATDSTLTNEIGEGIAVFKTKSFEPINLYAKVVGKNNVPTAGFSNVDNKRILQKIITSFRSNFFIPDPRRGWNNYAYRKALEIIKKERIDTIITTSPPHSTQLIGLKLKRKLGLKWIADLRDPWTDIYYYKILKHSIISAAIDKWYEKRVFYRADKIITVSQGFKSSFLKKNFIPENKIRVISNGFDPVDFEHITKTTNDKYIISYTGTISEQYNPYVFLDILKEIIKKSNTEIVMRFIGVVFKKLKDYVKEIGIDNNVEFIPTVSHQKSIEFIVNSNALLLVIPKIKNSEGIVPGKLFEYLATQNPIVCIGDPQSDAAKIIKECNAGQTFDRHSNADLYNFLIQQIESHEIGMNVKINKQKVAVYSRQNQAKEYSKLILSLK